VSLRITLSELSTGPILQNNVTNRLMPGADLLSQMRQVVKRVKPDDFLQRERKLI